MIADNPLKLSETAYIVIECFHIAGFVLAVGMNAVVDLRLLGLALPQLSPVQLAADTIWWSAGGLIVAGFAGLLLLSTDPDMYLVNVSFLVKMVCLATAIAISYSIRRKATRVSSAWRKLIAAISLTLWVLVIFGGIFIANDILRIG